MGRERLDPYTRVEPYKRGDRPVDAAKMFQPLANAQPQHARRPAVGKKSQAVERHVEWCLTNRAGEPAADMLLDGVFNGPEKQDCEVHAIGAHPRRFRVRLDGVACQYRYTADLLTCGFVDIDSNK